MCVQKITTCPKPLLEPVFWTAEFHDSGALFTHCFLYDFFLETCKIQSTHENKFEIQCAYRKPTNCSKPLLEHSFWANRFINERVLGSWFDSYCMCLIDRPTHHGKPTIWLHETKELVPRLACPSHDTPPLLLTLQFQIMGNLHLLPNVLFCL